MARWIAGTTSGIIPAGAGHFQGRENHWGLKWDHPRRCGALPKDEQWLEARAGSSPQVRGTYDMGIPIPAAHRIIPAGAGHF